MGFGVVNQRNALSMSEFSILMLPQISALHCLLPINNMRTSNGMFMANVSEKLNTPHSLPWFFPLLEVWLMKPLSHKRLASLLSNKWDSVTLGWLYCCLCALLLPVSLVLGHHLVTLTVLHVQWIWLGWSYV